MLVWPQISSATVTNIDIGDDFFSPTQVSIQVADQVQWTWIGSIPHSSTSDSGLWDSGIHAGGQFKFIQAFNSSGQFPFHCTVHSFMTGSVTAAKPTNIPPSVSITNPVGGAVFIAPASFQLAASASDSDGTVTNVQFFQGTASLGNVATSPFVVSINNLLAGDYSFSAVATDNGGVTATNTVTVHVQNPLPNQPPSVSITNPADGAVFIAPASFQLSASASDSDGTVTNVQFFQGTDSLGNIATSPFDVSVNNLQAGDYSFSAVATDNGGLTATNTITVHVQIPPNQAPSVSITNPVDGAVFVAPASFQLGASASDSDGTVTNVQFFQGTDSLGNIATSPFAVSINNLMAGDYSFSAIATDNGGLTATNTITVHVQNPLPNQPPSVSITNPADGAVFIAPTSFQLAASASDSDGTVTNVQFFQWTASLGNVATSPFAVSINNLMAGDYSFSAIATDNGGLTATNTITVHVQNPLPNQPPSVSITNPPDGAVFIAPASFQLSGSASDPDGTVTNVQFFQGTDSLGNVSTSPFAVSVTNLQAGDYSFSAIATDNGGLTATNSITVHVQSPPNQIPIVTITNPVDGVVLTAPASFQLAAAASDPDGTVTNVQFFQGTASLGNAVASPFVVSVNNLQAGDYSFSAVATDNGGLTATNTITVHVVAPLSISTSSLNFTQPGHFQFTYNAIIGRSYVVLKSTDLAAWVGLGTNTATSITGTFVDTNALSSSGFYRVQLLSN
jgi:uncharacterized protein (DUF2141 family)